MLLTQGDTPAKPVDGAVPFAPLVGEVSPFLDLLIVAAAGRIRRIVLLAVLAYPIAEVNE